VQEHGDAPDWRNQGVRVIKATSSIRTPSRRRAMNRQAAINYARVGAQKIWAGTVTIHPTRRRARIHHGPLESVILVRARARPHALGRATGVRCGAEAGDFIYCAAYVPLRKSTQALQSSSSGARAQRQRGGGGEPRYQSRGAAGSGVLGSTRSQAPARVRSCLARARA